MAGCAVVAAMLAGSCGGDEQSGDQLARADSGISEARIATNGSGDRIGLPSTSPDGDVVQGEPSLDQLDDSGPAPGAVGTPGAGCTGGDITPSGARITQISRATLCLVNLERTTRGLPALRANRQLARAAVDHARDMVKRSYFAHESLGGGGFIGRIKARGYMAGRRSWTVGENLAWGGGVTGSPREIVALWMKSQPHRANILYRRFRDVGFGVVAGAPVRGGGVAEAATYGSEFGARGSR